MEENKKVFIRGRKGREKEVVDILTGLGANVPKYNFGDSDDFIYFINHRNEIGIALIDSEDGAIIMDNYKEIELPRRPWKDGDILAYGTDSEIYCSGAYAVFKEYTGNNTFQCYIVINGYEMRFGTSFPTDNFHLAKEEEKEHFSKMYNYMMSYLKAANDLLRKDTE